MINRSTSICLLKSISEDINKVTKRSINIKTIISGVVQLSNSTRSSRNKCVCILLISRRSTNVKRDCSCIILSRFQNLIIYIDITFVRICNLSFISIISTSKDERLALNGNKRLSCQRVGADGKNQIASCRIICCCRWGVCCKCIIIRISNSNIISLLQTMRTSDGDRNIICDEWHKCLQLIICPDSFSDFSLNMSQSNRSRRSIDIKCRSIPDMTIRTIAKVFNQCRADITNIIFTIDCTTRNSK